MVVLCGEREIVVHIAAFVQCTQALDGGAKRRRMSCKTTSLHFGVKAFRKLMPVAALAESTHGAVCLEPCMVHRPIGNCSEIKLKKKCAAWHGAEVHPRILWKG